MIAAKKHRPGPDSEAMPNSSLAAASLPESTPTTPCCAFHAPDFATGWLSRFEKYVLDGLQARTIHSCDHRVDSWAAHYTVRAPEWDLALCDGCLERTDVWKVTCDACGENTVRSGSPVHRVSTELDLHRPVKIRLAAEICGACYIRHGGRGWES